MLDTERTRQFTERAIDMKIKAQMDPGMKYDMNQINPGDAEDLDPWEMRKRLGCDGDTDKAISTILPAGASWERATTTTSRPTTP